MSSFKLSLKALLGMPPSPLCPPPVHLAFSPDSSLLGILYSNGKIQVYELGLRTGPKGKIADPKIIWSSSVDEDLSARKDSTALTRPRQIVLSDTAVLVLGADEINQKKDAVQITPIKASPDSARITLSVPPLGRLLSHSYYQDAQGRVYTLNNPDLTNFAAFPRFCAHAEAISTSLGELLVGLDSSGRLISSGVSLQMINDKEVTPSSGIHNEVAHNVNSFSITSGFLVFTTTAHEIKFAPIADLFVPEVGEKERSAWGVRRVERGSRIVCVVPANASVVLQLPRGNLETINPRPLVLASVRTDVEQ
jgi:elongator complex protein 1